MEYWRDQQARGGPRDPQRAGSSYVQDLQNALEALCGPARRGRRPRPGRARAGVRPAGRPDSARDARARWDRSRASSWSAEHGGLAEQLGRISEAGRPAAARKLSRPPAAGVATPAQLEYFNGLGGFAQDGREYVTILGPGQSTPAPWINVIANPAFGFQVSAEGCGFTWSVNSREHQLTPWSNDPVADRPGEAIYLRDGNRRALVSDRLPIRDDAGAYVARHGWGYSRFEHEAHGVAFDLLLRPAGDPIKISRLKLRNTTNAVAGCPSRPMSNGCSARPAPHRRRSSSTEIDPDPQARCSLATHGTPRSARGSPSSTWADARRAGRRSPGVHRPQRLPLRPCRPGRRRRFPGRSARASIRAARCRPSRSAPRRGNRNRALPRRRRRPQRGGGTDQAVSRCDLDAVLDEVREHGRTSSARFRSRRPIARWTSC